MTEKSSTLMPDTVIAQTSPGVSAMMGEHLVMLSVEQGAYFDLNPTAKLIWESLSSPRTMHELCMIIHEEYEVSEQDCRDSVERFVLELHKENMVSLQDLTTQAVETSQA
ncbi:PqqD family peptide modification chaperone [Ectopseudomonas mendocina]|uniref:PqqD family peptide modification chaperone n=1 Tax=Ectopseudomonas mendocina TaxID=300 RepID=UPI0005A29261|nr:PqqD family peptide modification chaperone [Pseudomonas mendocina]